MKSITTKLFKTGFLLLGISFLVTSCEENEAFEVQPQANLYLDLTGETTIHGTECLVIDENNPLNRYSRIDSVKVYGLGIEFYIPDSLKNLDLTLVFSGKMRETESITSNLAVSLLNTKDSLVFWAMVLATNHITESNKWVPFKDSLTISSSANSGEAKLIKIFSSKGLGRGFFDVDDLKIDIKKN